MSLEQKLLPDQQLFQKKEKQTKSKQRKGSNYINSRLSMIYSKLNDQLPSVNRLSYDDQQKYIRSKIGISIYNSEFSKQEIAHGQLILQEPTQKIIQPLQIIQQNNFSSQSNSKICVTSIYRQKKQQNTQLTHPKDLNHRIFNLNSKVQKFLYYFNIIFNTIFRLGLIVILIFLFLQQDKHKFGYILIGLEVSAIFLYTIAITKIVFTKSGLISVYFQKLFYQKPYADIQIDRILRKHFTVHRIYKNFWTFINYKSYYNKDLKISLLKQQFLKRIQLILVFVPFVTVFTFQLGWFQFSQFPDTSSQTFIAGVILVQFFRLCLHYLIIYVTS